MNINRIYKSLFSRRMDIVPTPELAVMECLPQSVINVITSCYYLFCKNLQKYNNQIHGRSPLHQEVIEQELWWRFCQKPLEDFCNYRSYEVSFQPFICNSSVAWYEKLDMLELVIRWSREQIKSSSNLYIQEELFKILESFIKLLNNEFERLNFGYRIVNDCIINITSEEERKCIEEAFNLSHDNISQHLKAALENYRLKPNPDVCGSIKESISAVEAACREYTGLTGDNGSLGKALKQLEDNGIVLHAALKSGFEKLYTWTNSADTGIRHALMDPEGKYSPSVDEAYLMLIQCSAFINYLRMKATRR